MNECNPELTKIGGLKTHIRSFNELFVYILIPPSTTNWIEVQCLKNQQ